MMTTSKLVGARWWLLHKFTGSVAFTVHRTILVLLTYFATGSLLFYQGINLTLLLLEILTSLT